MDPNSSDVSRLPIVNRSQSKLFNQVLSVLPGIVLQLRQLPDYSMELVYASHNIQTLFKITPQEVADNPRTLLSKVHSDDLAKLLASFKYASQHFTALSCEFRLRLSPPKNIWVHLNAQPELESDSSLLWTAYIQDISEKKLLSEKLLMSNLSMQHTHSDISDFLFEIDELGTVLVTHSAFSITMSNTDDAMVGRNIKEILPSCAVELVFSLIQSVDSKFVRLSDFYSVESNHEKTWFEVTVFKKQDASSVYVVLIRDITSKQRAQDQLSIIHVALNAVSHGVVVTDIEHNVVAANEAFTKITGYTFDDVKGKNLRLKQGKETDQQTVAEIRKSLQSNLMFDGELLNYRKDGSSFWNQLTVIPVFNAHDELVNYLGILRDMTDRKMATQRARIDAVAFNALSDAIMVTDAQRIIVSVNQAFSSLTGFVRDEVIGKKARIFASINSPEVIIQIRKAFAKQVAFDGQVLSYKKDGSIFKNQLSIRPVFDSKNRLTHFVSVLKDVTEKEVMQRAIEESRNLLLNIIDVAPLRIYWKDKTARYLGCNQAFADDLGLTPQDIYGKRDDDIMSADDAKKNHEVFNTIMQDGESRLFYEQRSLDQHGQVCWTLKSKVPLKNARGDMIGVLGIYEDITARKIEQEKLKQTKQALLESSERYLDLYEFAPIGYLSLDTHGIVVEANWKARSMLGMKRKDVGKERFSRYVTILHKKDWLDIFANIKSMSIGGELEIDLPIGQDQDHPLQSKLSCVRVDDRNNQSILRITIADITQAKHAENMLRQKESYQRSLLDNFPFMVWLKDEKSRLLTVNNEYLKNVGFSSVEEVVGKTELELWSTETAKSCMRDDLEVMQSRKPKTLDELIEVGGKYVWYETYISPVVVNDNVVGTVGFARDISQRKRATLYDQFRTHILELLAREHNVNIIFDAITKGLEQLNPMMFCLIALSDNDRKTLSIASAPSLPAFFVEALEGIKIGMGMGSIGTVAFTKQRLIVADVMTHPFWDKNKALAQKAGIGSSWEEPIIAADGQILGAFGVYHHHSHSPSEDDITLIEQSARLISLAVERHKSSAKIESLAYYDEVTSLPNRRFLLEQLKRAMAINLETKVSVAVLYLDIDQFKSINDSRGHDVGDLLLIEVSNRLKRAVQAVDVVARVGGDEFVVLLENLSEHALEAARQAEVIAHKILTMLSKPYTLAKHKHHSSASIGITVIGNKKTDIEEVLKQADIAMFQAKKNGRNTFCFFDHKMQANISTLVMLENELRNAIKNNQLHLCYQVQVDHMGHPFGAEALLRWKHPERGMVSPAQFIPLAEESGLIIPIGQWVLDTACAQIKAWQAYPSTRDLTLSVNISAKQFRQANFVEQVQSCVERHGIDPMFLRLELTESMLLENVEETVEYMNALGKLGVQFSLDDFGTGYSSLQYLKRLPLYQLKIDQSFVRDLVNDSHDRTIVRTIIAMAQSMYVGVIAEGVETVEQQELLLINGCRRYQGYLFGKPVPIHEFNARFELPNN